MGFRLAILQSFAVLASAFSGLISFGVFQINSPAVKGWQWLFIIEGGMTLIIGIIGFFLLPESAQKAWFLDEREKEAARARMLRDSSSEVDAEFNLKECFRSWNNWQFPVWCIITFTYPVAYATAMNFFPLVSALTQSYLLKVWPLTYADRWALGFLYRQNQFVDCSTKPCWCSGATLRREVIWLFPWKNTSHHSFFDHFSGRNGDSRCHRCHRQQGGGLFCLLPDGGRCLYPILSCSCLA